MTSEEAQLQFQSVNARCDTIEAGQTNIKSELVQTNEGIAHIELTLRSIHLNAHPQPTITNSATPIQGTYQVLFYVVGRILVRCKTRLQVPDSTVQAWSQQSRLRRDKIQYFGKVLQNSPLTSHKMQLNRAILTMILPCQ